MQKFSDEAWAATVQIRERIDKLPLLIELADGTLDPQRFVEYIVQDDFYLRGYARALAMLGTRAPNEQETGFWVASSGGAVAAEVGACLTFCRPSAFFAAAFLRSLPHHSRLCEYATNGGGL